MNQQEIPNPLPSLQYILLFSSPVRKVLLQIMSTDSSSDKVEIVASFPLPPKQFYEHLTVEEILQLKAPEIPKESIKTFGIDQVQFL